MVVSRLDMGMNAVACEERRDAPRIGCRLPVLRIVGDSTQLDYTLDLSESGMGVVTNDHLILGQEMHVRFVHPVFKRDLWADAACVWVADERADPPRPRRGGLRFIHVDPNVRTLLAELVRSGAPGSPPAPATSGRPSL